MSFGTTGISSLRRQPVERTVTVRHHLCMHRHSLSSNSVWGLSRSVAVTLTYSFDICMYWYGYRNNLFYLGHVKLFYGDGVGDNDDDNDSG